MLVDKKSIYPNFNNKVMTVFPFEQFECSNDDMLSQETFSSIGTFWCFQQRYLEFKFPLPL